MSIQIVPQEGLGEFIGKGLGKGIAEGSQAAAKMGLSQRLKMHDAKQKGLEAIAKGGPKYFKSFPGLEDEDDDSLRDLMKKAKEHPFTALGSSSQAMEAVAMDLLNERSQKAKVKEFEDQAALEQGLPPKEKRGPTDLPFRPGDLYRNLFGRRKDFTGVERGKRGPSDAQGGLVGQIKEGLEQAGKPLTPEEEKAREEFLQLPFEQRAAISKDIGQRAQQDVNIALGEGAFPGIAALSEKLRKEGSLPEKVIGPNAEALMRITGAVAPITVSSKASTALATKLFPKNAVMRALAKFGSMFTAGATEGATQQKAMTGETPTKEDVFKHGLMWALFESPELIGAVGKELGAAKPKVKAAPKVKGEPTRYYKVSKEAPELGKKIEKPRGVGKEELVAREKATKAKAKDISKRPLEELFPEKKEVKHRPETIAKERVRVAAVESEISPLKADLEGIPKQRIALQNEREFASPTRKTEIRSEIDNLKSRQESLKGRIKDLEFQKKYKKLPEREIDISGRAIKSVENLKESITKGDAKALAKATKSIEADKALIERTKALMKKGSLSPTEVLDEFTKIKKAYRDVYTDVIRNLEEDIKFTQDLDTVAAKKELKISKKLKEVLEKRKAKAEADLFRHQEKRSIQKMTKGAKGAFLRNEVSKLIKSTEGDLAFLKNNAFKLQKRGKPSITIKTERVAKAFKKLEKSPTIENVKNAAKESGANPEKVANIAKEAEAAAKEGGEKMKDFIKKYGKKIENTATTPAGKSKAKSIFKSFIRGTLRKMGIPSTGGGIVYSLYRLRDGYQIEKYKKLRKSGDVSSMAAFKKGKSREEMTRIRNASKKEGRLGPIRAARAIVRPFL